MRKKAKSPLNALLPYEVICAAAKGSPDAISMVLNHYKSYIATLATKEYMDASGNVYTCPDRDMMLRLEAKLTAKILLFRAED